MTDQRLPTFGRRLILVKFSALFLLASELLRTHCRMAASEPTSWLSEKNNFLSNLDDS